MTDTIITTWWSAAGGVGKTTLAVAHAQELAKQHKDDVALMDFSEARPDIYKLLDQAFLDPNKVLNAIENGAIANIKDFMSKKGNMYVFTGIPLEQFEMFQEKHFSAIIRSAKENFKHIIIDTNAGIFFSATAAALKASDKINVVLRPDILCLEDTATMINFLSERWGIDINRFRFNLNRILPGNLDLETAERVLGREIIEISLKLGKIQMPFKKPKKGFFNFLERSIHNAYKSV
ncbi:MAG TPA: AAA family ATPase [Thermoanaerobacterales bacterium]|nr:AAA family ATPase [Thermoanaerobacterales bacterium]